MKSWIFPLLYGLPLPYILACPSLDINGHSPNIIDRPFPHSYIGGISFLIKGKIC